MRCLSDLNFCKNRIHGVRRFLPALLLLVGQVGLMANPEPNFGYAKEMAQQSTINVKGKVVDEDGQPLIGVGVFVSGTTNGTTTDMDGNFTLSVPQKSTLEFSFLGFETVKMAAQGTMNVTMRVDSELLDETVVVGYGTQKKASLSSAISNIRSEELNATKQTDVLASLQGKVPGLQIHQNTGDLGEFNTDLKIRGYGEPIVVIDGMVRTAPRTSQSHNSSYSNSSSAVLAQLNPEDIESISVLKDASAAIYGMGAENGVIVVTTKQGSIGAPSVKYSNRFSFGVPTALPEEVDIVTWFNVRNEMLANVGKGKEYSDEFIQHYIDGDEGYNDYKWYSEFYRKSSFSQNHQVSVNGGNNQTQYYLSGSFNSDNGILNGPQLNYKKFNFQGNVTTNINKNLKVVYQSQFSWNTRTGYPDNTNQNFFQKGLSAERYYPWTALDNPLHWTNNPGTEGRNPIAALKGESGYDITQQSSFTNNLNATYSAPFLKGLKISGQMSYDFQTRQTRILTLSYPLYDPWTDEHVADNKDENTYEENWDKRQNLYGKIQANYNKNIKKHSFGALLAAEATLAWSSNISASRNFGEFYTHDIINQGDKSTAENSGSRSSNAKAGYIGRLNYEYDGKYIVEAMARYDGSYFYAPGYRWAFLPSYSVAWRVSEESFFKNLFPKINNFKLRWSDGISGGNQGSAYQYLLGYSQTGTTYMFDDGTPTMGYSSTQTAETLLSWTKTYMRDFGFDWEYNKGILGGSIDWFWREVTGKQARYSNTVPDMYGLNLPYLNLNSTQNVGIDLELSHRMRFKDFNYRITGTLTFSRKRDTYIEAERTALYTSAYNYYTSHTEGRWDNALDGKYYEWNGYGQFNNLKEIYDYPVLYQRKDYNSNKVGNNSQILPGTYKVEDRNGDGVITSEDQYYSWKEGNPPLQFGFMFFFEYKGFDLSATFNGAGLCHKEMALSGGMGYGYYKTLYTYHMDHYTLADGYTDPRDPNSEWVAGYWPALAPANKYDDKASYGTYRYAQPYSWINGRYLRLKSLEIGYTIPKSLLSKVKIKNARVYASGTNLLTFCDPVLKQWDPETNQNAYRGASGSPLLKTFVIGTSISF